MERKFFLGQYLIWVILLHGYKSCIQKEKLALLELKKYIISQSRLPDFVLPTWTNDTRSDCCRWEGLKCNRTSGRVTEIVLSDLFLKESSLFNLYLLHPFEEVRSLNFSTLVGGSCFFDDVEGYKSLGKLRNLEILDLSRNKFNNSIFPFLNAATSLTTLFLRDNNLDGPFPAKELKDLTNLELLDLSSNRFNGSIPVQELSSLRKLKALDLSGNEFYASMGLQGICELKNMQELDLSGNKLVGKIGQGLRSLRYLELLEISNNNLTGVIPSWIGQLQSLVVVLLSNNSLEGEIPISLFNRTFLQLLDLSANILSGGIPPQVHSRYPVALFLQDNKLSGVIPDTLLTNVTVLDLRNNRLSGNIPDFTNTRNTHTLLLRGNNLTGTIRTQLCGLRNIQLLDLSNNRLSGSIPSSFVFGKEEDILYDYDYGRTNQLDLAGGFEDPFKSLIVLDPFSMKMSPVELGGLLEIQALNPSHNNLSGLIPQGFSGLKNVESLDLSFNRLQGRIPPRLTDLSSLAVFNVSYNNLSGAIPLGRQFSTFDTQSFLGNPLLCGIPTSRSCEHNSNFQELDNGVKDDESQIDMVSFYWSFAAAYVTIFLGIFLGADFGSTSLMLSSIRRGICCGKLLLVSIPLMCPIC